MGRCSFLRQKSAALWYMVNFHTPYHRLGFISELVGWPERMPQTTLLGIQQPRSIVISSEVEKSPCCIVLLLIAPSALCTEILHYVQNDEWGGKVIP